ncbi:MAG: response regulator [Cyclobacteriaceae bacterium]
MLVFNVDDDSDDREIFCDAVKSVHPNISCAQVDSGISALQFLDKGDPLPDYLFIDINMPKMNGIECVQRIRSVPRFLSIQIVMYSTTFNRKDEIYFSEMGIKCLAKKTKFSDLVSSLKALLLNEIPVLVE